MPQFAASKEQLTTIFIPQVLISISRNLVAVASTEANGHNKHKIWNANLFIATECKKS